MPVKGCEVLWSGQSVRGTSVLRKQHTSYSVCLWLAAISAFSLSVWMVVIDWGRMTTVSNPLNSQLLTTMLHVLNSLTSISLICIPAFHVSWWTMTAALTGNCSHISSTSFQSKWWTIWLRLQISIDQVQTMDKSTIIIRHGVMLRTQTLTVRTYLSLSQLLSNTRGRAMHSTVSSGAWSGTTSSTRHYRKSNSNFLYLPNHTNLQTSQMLSLLTLTTTLAPHS